MKMLLSELAGKLGLVLKGRDRKFTGLNTLEGATEDEISFLSNPKYTRLLSETKACAVIVAPEFQDEVETALVSENPYVDFARASAMFDKPEAEFSGISEGASIDPSAVIGQNCTIYPFAFIGPRAVLGDGVTVFPGAYIGADCVIGKGSVLFPGAVVLQDVTLGEKCVLNAGSVIGTDGFGFVRFGGAMQKIPQIGTVVLEDGVDVGANSCIDRAALGATRAGKDTKFDNLVQIGHNVTLGEQCLIISQVGIAGSTKVGDRVTMAGQAGIAGHLNIGNDVTIGPQAGVPKDIADGVTGSGNPFVEGRNYMRTAVLLTKLPELQKKVQDMEKELASLKALLAESGKTEEKA